MATLEYVAYTPSRHEFKDNKISWGKSGKPIRRLPQICWENGSAWAEANLWALELATTERNALDTVIRKLAHVLTYAKWLETEAVNWWHFPDRESDRCLIRFRGALVQARESGALAPSTISHCMTTVVALYRWFAKEGLLAATVPMWRDRQLGIRLKDRFGLDHTIRVNSTNLSIPNRKVAGAFSLEEGLLPVSIAEMKEIIEFADAHASQEFALKLRIGFQTGLRIGSITDLKIQTLLNSEPDRVAGWHRLSVGPGASPPVATKFGVNGKVPIPTELLETLRLYVTSTRYLQRRALAGENNRDLVFLTRYGNPYRGDMSRAINCSMTRLRQAGELAGITALRGFHAHRTRATFATELMRVALRHLSVGDAINVVREACLHADEATTFGYVHFLEATKAMAEVSNAFTELFLGLVPPSELQNA